MYSDMSSRTIAASSSNRNCASARASSVFPTPVGPRNRNEPIGLRGSLSPDFARRTASETRRTASSCPTTRAESRSSMDRSFLTSPSTSRETGIPVHRETISATSSSSTSSFSRRVGPSAAGRDASSTCFCRAGMVPYLSCDAFSRFPSRSARSISEVACSSFSLTDRTPAMPAFSRLQRSRSASIVRFSSAISPSIFRSRGRSPCPAGTGRRCSGGTASPRRLGRSP